MASMFCFKKMLCKSSCPLEGGAVKNGSRLSHSAVNCANFSEPPICFSSLQSLSSSEMVLI